MTIPYRPYYLACDDPLPNLCVDCRKLDTKKKALGRLEEQLHKLEVQATDKVYIIVELGVV